MGASTNAEAKSIKINLEELKFLQGLVVQRREAQAAEDSFVAFLRMKYKVNGAMRIEPDGTIIVAPEPEPEPAKSP